MDDTPLLVNIKGCGYPPEIACALFASKYNGKSNQLIQFSERSVNFERTFRYPRTLPKNDKTIRS